MADPRTTLCEQLGDQLDSESAVRDRWWETYWQRRQVVVVPDAQDDGPTDESPEMRIHRRDWNDAQSTISALRSAWPKLQDRERRNILGASDSFDAALGAYLKRPLPESGGWPGQPDGGGITDKNRDIVMTTDAIAARKNGGVVRDCIARLKAAREKEAVNKNLSTLLAVVVKVQRDLEALLNGSGER